MDKMFNVLIATITATRWQLFKARLFGTSSVWIADGYRTTSLHYKGITYIVKHEALN